MKTISFIILAALLLMVTGVTAAQILGPIVGGGASCCTYYIDQTAGNDSNSGRTPALAWKTIAKVNGTTLMPGQSVGFKRGETWRETLTPGQSGTAGNPITFTAYGSGAKPIISGSDVVTGWGPTTVSYDFTGGSLPAGVTLTRASAATYFNSSGVLSTATTDVARFNYIGATPYLLIEPAASNLALQSNTFLTSPWAASAPPTANSFTSPDGSNNGWDVSDAASYGSISQAYTFSAVPYTLSVWAYRRKGTSPLTMGITWGHIANQATSATITRHSYTATVSAGADPIILGVNSDISNSLGLFGVQLETGSVATSYIPTTTGAGSRSADVARFTIPVGITALTYTFDDDSTQEVEVSPGAYNIPTNLNRPNIKSITGSISGGSANIWQASSATNSRRVFFNGTLGTHGANVAALTSANKWYWASNVLYVYSETDPDTAYTSPGVEAAIRSYGINITTSYDTFDSLHVTKTNDDAVHNYTDASISSNITVQGCLVDWAARSGIYSGHDADAYGIAWVIRNNTISNNGYAEDSIEDHGIYASWGTGWIIENNLIQNNLDYGVQLSSSTDNLIKGNTISGHGTGGIVLFDNGSGGSTGNSLFYNVLANNGGYGMNLSNSTLAGNLIYHNTIYGYTSIGLYIADDPAALGTIKNNIVWSTLSPTHGAIFNYGSTQTAGMVSDYNLLGPEATEYLVWKAHYYSTLAAYVTGESLDAHSKKDDPLFTNAAGGDFTIPTNSPAYQSGVFIAGVSTSATPNRGAK